MKPTGQGDRPPRVAFAHGSRRIVFAYDHCVKVWEYTKAGELQLAGSTQHIEGTVVSATPVAHGLLVVEVRQSGTSRLQVHRALEAHEDGESSLVQTLVLPPSANGPGPYHVVSRHSRYMAIVAADGLVSLFSIDKKAVQLLPLSGMQVRCTPDGKPLLDLVGAWLALVPAKATMPAGLAPVVLPPSDSVTERVVDSLSNTAAASFKTISDAGKASFRHYWYGEGATSGNGNTNGGGYVNGQHHVNRSINGHGTNGGRGEGANSRLRALGSMLAGDSNDGCCIQLIDIPEEKTICQFAPAAGGPVSFLACSPFDAVLVAASAKGDSLWSYDLTFVPDHVAVTGRYVRGRVPNRVVDIVWDDAGGFGVVTADKGSLHWFNKRVSLHPSNKVWKLSGWNFESGMLVGAGTGGAPSEALILRHGELIVVDPSTGAATWTFDVPTVPSKALAAGPLETSTKKKSESESPRQPDPLSFFELETCLPYPFLYTDRKVVLSTFMYENSDMYRVPQAKNRYERVSMSIFGMPLATAPIDFGIPRGQVKFSPEQAPTEGADDELAQAMENAGFETVEPIPEDTNGTGDLTPSINPQETASAEQPLNS